MSVLPGKSHGQRSLVGCSPWGRDWATSLSLFTFMHGRRNWHPLQCSCLENPMDGEAWWAAVHGVATERLHFHLSLSHIGEGNGNPLQCSCLENPRDRGAWWAAVSGVTQCRTQLKWLCSSRFLLSPILKRVFFSPINGGWILSRDFSASIEIIIWF